MRPADSGEQPVATLRLGQFARDPGGERAGADQDHVVQATAGAEHRAHDSANQLALEYHERNANEQRKQRHRVAGEESRLEAVVVDGDQQHHAGCYRGDDPAYFADAATMNLHAIEPAEREDHHPQRTDRGHDGNEVRLADHVRERTPRASSQRAADLERRGHGDRVENDEHRDVQHLATPRESCPRNTLHFPTPAVLQLLKRTPMPLRPLALTISIDHPKVPAAGPPMGKNSDNSPSCYAEFTRRSHSRHHPVGAD